MQNDAEILRRYLELPGVEILLRCARDLTEFTAHGIVNELVLEREFVPTVDPRR
jgi:hypothetical protein